MNIRQVETSVRNAVKLILSELEDKYIKFAYAPNGQPAFFPSENVIFVWAEESRDDYGRQSETVAEYSPETDSEKLARSRTVVYSVHFIAYGPDSSENINRIKSGMLNESVRRELSSGGLFYIPRMDAPSRVNENNDGLWWKRWDWQAEFNYLRTDREEINYISSADISVSSN